MKQFGLFALFAASAFAHPAAVEEAAVARDFAEVLESRQSTCSGPVAGNTTTWWRAAIGHNGTTPMSTDATFQYYRTAIQYGADPTGVQDSSDAFNFAIDAWSRTGNTVTTRPAFIYVPPGKYLIKKSIQMLVSTYLIGDALNPPTLIADPALGTNPVINGYDSHQGDGSATKNFYMAIRNIVIDTTAIPTSVVAVGIDWSVSQGCSLTNMFFRMPPYSNHIGVTMVQGGSGILISDSSFEGGAIGIRVKNQQYDFKNLSFNGCNVGIKFEHVYVATLQGISFKNCNYGVDMGSVQTAGTVSLVDSKVEACNAGVNAAVSWYGEGSLVIDGFEVVSATAVKAQDGSTLLQGSIPIGQTWVMGYVNSGSYQRGTFYPINRPAGLVTSNGKYFTKALPQYEKYDLDQFISLKGDPEFPVYGDHAHDDGPNINAILQKYAGCKIVFVPQGVYLTHETIYVPAGTRMVGETLSIFTGNGSTWWNSADPKPILQVGKPGETGIVEISDITIETSDVLQGAILVEVNIEGINPGDVGFWSVVARVGGSKHSLVNTNCANPDPSVCKAAFALLHVTPSASAYFENFWGWVADHSLDGGPGQNIAVGRGAVVQSTKPTWWVGTSFEHCVLYQYAFLNASNVFIGLEQTEAPYWQGEGSPRLAPEPWLVNATWGDPTYANCAATGQGSNARCYRAWGHYQTGSSDMVIHGSALWAFFNGMTDNLWHNAECQNTGGNCMTNQAFIGTSSKVFWYSMSSKSTSNLIVDDGSSTGVPFVSVAADNPGSWGGVVAAYLRVSGI